MSRIDQQDPKGLVWIYCPKCWAAYFDNRPELEGHLVCSQGSCFDKIKLIRFLPSEQVQMAASYALGGFAAARAKAVQILEESHSA